MTARKKSFLIFLLAVFLMAGDFCSAKVPFLEVNYPTLSAGEAINKNTPFPDYVVYIFKFGMSLGFLAVFIALIVGGFLYILSNARPGLRGDAKSRIFSAISGLILLLTTYLIISTISPRLRIINLAPLEELPGLFITGGGERKPIGLMGIFDKNNIPSFDQIAYRCDGNLWPSLIVSFYERPYFNDIFDEEILNCDSAMPIGTAQSFNFKFESPGIYLYLTDDCSVTRGSEPAHYISSSPDLGDLKNAVQSIRSVSSDEGDEYFAVLYDEINYRGGCEIINAIGDCRRDISPFVSSISVYKRASEAEGSGVIFFRKSFHEEKNKDSWYKIGNSEIPFSRPLSDLRFQEVPAEEKNCTKWDFKGECLEKENPTLEGENISSIKIGGNYLTILYHDSGNPYRWDFCQEFPTPDDINRKGPKQIKWEYILRETLGKLPNRVLIIPKK